MYGNEFKVPKRNKSMEKNLKYKKGIKVQKRKDGKEFKVPKRNKSMEKNLKYKKEIKVPKRN